MWAFLSPTPILFRSVYLYSDMMNSKQISRIKIEILRGRASKTAELKSANVKNTLEVASSWMEKIAHL